MEGGRCWATRRCRISRQDQERLYYCEPQVWQGSTQPDSHVTRECRITASLLGMERYMPPTCHMSRITPAESGPPPLEGPTRPWVSRSERRLTARRVWPEEEQGRGGGGSRGGAGRGG